MAEGRGFPAPFRFVVIWRQGETTILRILTLAIAITTAAPAFADTLALRQGHSAPKPNDWKVIGQITIESIGFADPVLRPHLFDGFPPNRVRKIAFAPRDQALSCKRISAMFDRGPSYDIGPESGYFQIDAPGYGYVMLPESAGRPQSLLMPCTTEGGRSMTVDILVSREQEDTKKWTLIGEIRAYSGGGKMLTRWRTTAPRLAFKPLDTDANCSSATITFKDGKTRSLDLKLLPADKMTALDFPDGGGEVHGANLACSLRKIPVIIEVYAAKP